MGKERYWLPIWCVSPLTKTTQVWNWPLSCGSESQAYFSRPADCEILNQGDCNLLQIASAEKYLSYFKEIFTVNKYREVDFSHWIMKIGRNILKDFYFFFF